VEPQREPAPGGFGGELLVVGVGGGPGGLGGPLGGGVAAGVGQVRRGRLQVAASGGEVATAGAGVGAERGGQLVGPRPGRQ